MHKNFVNIFIPIYHNI